MRTSRIVPSLSLLVASAAFAAPPTPTPAPGTPTKAAAAAPGQTAPAAKPGAPAGYSGHGAESVSPELLERHRPRPLPPEVSRRIQSLLDVRGPGMGQLTPDGKRLFFTWNVTGTSQIWTVDGPMRFPVQLTGGDDITQLAAVTPDGKWLVVQRDRKGEENPGLYLQDPAGGPLTVVQHIPGVQTRFSDISDDSRMIYFTSNDIRKDAYAIYRYDLRDKKRELLYDGPGLWSVADVRADGHLLLSKATGSLSAEIFDFDPATKALTPLFGQNEKEEYDVAWGAAPGEVLAVTNKLGEFRRLYRWTPKDPKLTLVAPPSEKDSKYDVKDFTIDRRRTRVLFQTNEDGFTRLYALDAKTWKPVALPKIDADHVLAGRTTPDSRYTTLAVDDGRHPLRAWVLDWKTGKLVAWHQPSAPELDTTRFARATLERYPARDGAQIPVLVRTPERCARELCPVVVHFHGGPEGQTLPGFSTHAQMFVDGGFVFVEPNVRGSDGYGKSWLHADDGPKRLEVITDIEDAAKWARTRFAAGGKAPKVGVYGGSYGGYSVLMAMTLFAGAYDAGVDVVGISDLRTFLKNTAPYRRLLRITEYGDPEKDAEALAKLSPSTYVDRVKAPLLILQGATDPRVPAGEAIQMYEAIKKKGVATDLQIFADEGHGAQKRENRVLMFGHAVAFLQQHLGVK